MVMLLEELALVCLQQHLNGKQAAHFYEPNGIASKKEGANKFFSINF